MGEREGEHCWAQLGQPPLLHVSPSVLESSTYVSIFVGDFSACLLTTTTTESLRKTTYLFVCFPVNKSLLTLAERRCSNVL